MTDPAETPASGQFSYAGLASISVVIPVWNAAARLPPLLAQLHAAGVGEILLADGGSTDGTASLPGVRVIEAPRGRGTQLRAGMAAARLDWLLVLHADTRLDAGWEAALTAAMQDASRAHYFAFALDDPSPQARRLERAVAWRCRALALPYGDQGLFLHRHLYDSAGGYAPIPLMEDVDLVRRLGRTRLNALPARAITSAEKWQREGWIRRSTHNLTTLALWFLGTPPERLARRYTRR